MTLYCVGKYDARTRAMILGVAKFLSIRSSLVEMMEESAVKFLTETIVPKTEYVSMSQNFPSLFYFSFEGSCVLCLCGFHVLPVFSQKLSDE
jgi:hypothetical protein